jgi:hypothetical protein
VSEHSHSLVKLKDTFFACASSPDPGTKECICSRCKKPILAGVLAVTVRFNEPQPVLGYPLPGEWRYHRDCVGMS